MTMDARKDPAGGDGAAGARAKCDDAPASSLAPPAQPTTTPTPGGHGFVVICPEKTISFAAEDREFHRDLHAAELKRELEFDVSEPVESTYAYLPGGGARVLLPPSPSAAATEKKTTSLFVTRDAGAAPAPNALLPPEQEAAHGLFAVFKGILTNAQALAASVGVGGSGNTNDDTSSNAALLVRLYQKHGIHLLGRLEGSWSFCLFDAHQGRVLAARAPCGGVPLFEGKTAAGALVICCGAYLPPGSRDVHAIDPGCAKWGWSSAPRPFSSGVAQQREGRRAAGDRTILRRSTELPASPAAAAAAAAAAGNGFGSGGGGGGSGGGGGGHDARARRWSETSGCSSVSGALGPEDVAAASHPLIPRHPLHADAPAYVPPRRSSETSGGGNGGGGGGVNGASWRSGNGGGSARSSYDRNGRGGGSSARSSYDRAGAGGARASGEGGRPPVPAAAAAAAARRSSETNGQAAAAPVVAAAAGAQPPLAAATAAMGALKC
jgi:hypothetical protein